MVIFDAYWPTGIPPISRTLHMMRNWQLECSMAIKERRKFTPEFKREAVKLAEQPGRSLAAVARELGVERSVLKAWVDNFAAGRYEKDRSLPLKAAQQMENE
jgi:transposase-like protein